MKLLVTLRLQQYSFQAYYILVIIIYNMEITKWQSQILRENNMRGMSVWKNKYELWKNIEMLIEKAFYVFLERSK